MTPSKYQSAIFAFIAGQAGYTHDDGPLDWDKPIPEPYIVDFGGKRNCVVEAVAGSGKTTTIVKSLEFLPEIEDEFGFKSKPKALFVAFNSSIAKELRSRVPSNVQASTLNSAGWSICRENVPKVKLDEFKDANILQTFFSMDLEPEKKLYYKVRNGLVKLVSLMKALDIIRRPEAGSLNEIADKYDIEIPDTGDLPDFDFFATALDLFNRSCEIQWAMSYDDQVFQPIHNNWTFPRYDWVFGDEAQDWSPIQIALVCRLGQYGRVAAVGDRHQSIYGFRGADTDAIPNIIRDLDAVVLPLSICYRCPNKVIAEARKIVPHIEAPENNPKGEGIVRSCQTDDFERDVKEGDYVICRTTAPLVKRCLRQIRNGVKATVKGKDIGENLIGMLESLAKDPFTPVITFLEKLATHKMKQMEKLNKLGREQEASNLEDRCDTLEVLAMDCDTTRDIAVRIRSIFSDATSTGIIFMTGHRCKGLEGKKVWWLRRDLCPFPKATKPWQVTQEDNLCYVITTRAMVELVTVIKERDEK